jgi:hypothetical protein
VDEVSREERIGQAARRRQVSFGAMHRRIRWQELITLAFGQREGVGKRQSPPFYLLSGAGSADSEADQHDRDHPPRTPRARREETCRKSQERIS